MKKRRNNKLFKKFSEAMFSSFAVSQHGEVIKTEPRKKGYRRDYFVSIEDIKK